MKNLCQLLSACVVLETTTKQQQNESFSYPAHGGFELLDSSFCDAALQQDKKEDRETMTLPKHFGSFHGVCPPPVSFSALTAIQYGH